MNKKRLKELAQRSYARIARAGGSCGGPEGSRSCCAPAMDSRRLGQAIGYTFAELDTVPEDANLGLGCGCFAGRGVSPPEAKKEEKSGRLAELARRMRLRELASVGLPLGLRILAFFFAFSYLGHLINLALPTRWVMDLFGAGRFHAVPLAAALGVPLYLNAEVSMPAVKSFVEMGMSPGAALALIITGAGTSVGAIAGALVIAKKRIVGLVVASLLFGAVLAGYVYDLVLATA